jgi:hypothetical protein
MYGSKKPDGADNQQESLSSEELASWFLAGFIEGEGSVCVCVKAHPTARFGFIVQPEFYVYQHRLRRELLEMVQEYFGVGRIDPKQGNPDVFVYSVKSRKAILERVIPFLESHSDYSARRNDYQTFAAVARLLEAGFHKTPWGLAHIVELAYSMNMGGKQRRRPREAVLGRILRGHTPDALETGAKIWSDLHGDMES